MDQSSGPSKPISGNCSSSRRGWQEVLLTVQSGRDDCPDRVPSSAQERGVLREGEQCAFSSFFSFCGESPSAVLPDSTRSMGPALSANCTGPVATGSLGKFP